MAKEKPKTKWYAKLSKIQRKTYNVKNNMMTKKRVAKEVLNLGKKYVAPSRAEYFREYRLK